MKNKRGFGLLAIIFVLVIFAVIALGIVSLVVSGSKMTVDEYRYEKSFYLAEGGKNFAIKAFLDGYNDWTQNMGFPITRSFAGGGFIISTSNATIDSITLTSTGIITEESKTYIRKISSVVTRTRGAAGSFTEEYALYWGGGGSGGTTTLGNNVVINGDVATNGDISLGNGVTISGDVQSTGTVSGDTTGVTGTTETNVTKTIDPPILDTTYYDNLISIAGTYPVGNVTYQNTTLSGRYYVNGDVILRQTVNISGSAEIIATGTVNVWNNSTIGNNLTVISEGQITFGNYGIIMGSGNVWYSSTGVDLGNNTTGGSGCVLMSPGNITLGNSNNFSGLIYCGGNLSIGASNTLTGNIVASSITSIGNNTTVTVDGTLVSYSSITGLSGGTLPGLAAPGLWREVY